MHRIGFRLLVGTVIVATAFLGSGIAQDSTTPSIKSAGVPASPLSPEESLKWMEIEEGYRIRLIACEPQIVDPVGMQIDDAGRLWVVEMRDYPNGSPEPGQPPIGRIKILEDEDGDGFFERATLFAEGLSFPNGLQLWRDGVIATAAGELLYLRDTDGDGKADQREVLLRGFTVGNPQLRANHPSIGLDGWLYVANGLRGGKVEASALPSKDGPIDLTGKDLRLQLFDGRMEAITGPSQFGLTWDPFGHRYGCTNRQPCVEAIFDQTELAWSPLAGLVPVFLDAVPSDTASSVRPLVKAWTTSNLHAGQFTAACGVLVSHSDQLPKSSFGHALTCEPTGSLIQRRKLAREGGRTRADDESPKKEWLASHDSWFRPVNLMEGPNGAIYVADMYRAVIEHPEFVPLELKNRPDMRYGDTLGRIYCVEKVGSDKQPFGISKSKPMRSLSDESLVEQLLSPHDWTRRTAARILLERRSNSVGDSLKRLATSAPLPETRVHASGLLGIFQGWDAKTAHAILNDRDGRVRAAGWKWIREQSGTWRSELRSLAIEAIASNEVDELRGACWFLASESSAKDWSSTEQERLIRRCAEAASRHSEDGHSLMAISAACRNQTAKFLLGWLQLPTAVAAIAPIRMEKGVGKSKESNDIAAIAITRLGQSLSSDEQKELQAMLSHLAEEAIAPSEQRPQETKSPIAIARRRIGLALLEGLSAGKGRNYFSEHPAEWKWVSQIIQSEEIDLAQRSQGLRLLRNASTEQAIPIAMRILGGNDIELKKGAINGVATHHAPEFASWLFDQFGKGVPEVRNEVYQAIRSHPTRLETLVSRFESKEYSLRLLDAAQMQTLRSSGDAKMKERIAAVLEGAVNKDREKVVQQYMASLDLAADPKQGKLIFEKSCAACHRIGSLGSAVGPDISDSRTQTFDKLLVNILDPNRAIDSNYFRYVALSESGEVVDGILKEATASTITLRGQNAKEVVLNRSQIVELKSTGVSLMPEGMEAQIGLQPMADLLSYIKNWRYEEDGVPAQAKAK